jgi:hypothetical protein
LPYINKCKDNQERQFYIMATDETLPAAIKKQAILAIKDEYPQEN